MNDAGAWPQFASPCRPAAHWAATWAALAAATAAAWSGSISTGTPFQAPASPGEGAGPSGPAIVHDIV